MTPVVNKPPLKMHPIIVWVKQNKYSQNQINSWDYVKLFDTLTLYNLETIITMAYQIMCLHLNQPSEGSQPPKAVYPIDNTSCS